MLLLGIETCTPVSSVVLWGDDGVAAHEEVARGRGHLEFLVPAIERAHGKAGTKPADLTGVAVGIGPGLFTSMRVGIVTAKTVASALALPVVGISTIALVAFPLRERDELVCVCIDARRDAVFASLYRRGVRITEHAERSPADLADELRATGEPVMVAGNGAVAHRATFDDFEVVDAHPSAITLCEMAQPLFARGETLPPERVEPLYVRVTDAEINWEQRGVSIKRPLRIKPRKHAVEGTR